MYCKHILYLGIEQCYTHILSVPHTETQICRQIHTKQIVFIIIFHWLILFFTLLLPFYGGMSLSSPTFNVDRGTVRQPLYRNPGLTRPLMSNPNVVKPRQKSRRFHEEKLLVKPTAFIIRIKMN